MSKPDKAATRSHHKATWNPKPFVVPKVPTPKTSWWMVGCENSVAGRASFILAAHERARDAWSAKTPDHPGRAKT